MNMRSIWDSLRGVTSKRLSWLIANHACVFKDQDGYWIDYYGDYGEPQEDRYRSPEQCIDAARARKDGGE